MGSGVDWQGGKNWKGNVGNGVERAGFGTFGTGEGEGGEVNGKRSGLGGGEKLEGKCRQWSGAGGLWNLWNGEVDDRGGRLILNGGVPYSLNGTILGRVKVYRSILIN